MTGQSISHYRILEKLGEGGMGVVYRAEDTKLRRIVALKFLPPHATENRERFLREAQAAASLNHPNICTIFEVDEEHNFIAMESIEGPSVKEKIEIRPLPLEEALNIAIQACTGLQAAHEKGIVHRDIKPANLMLTAQGQVKVMDFGLAQIGDRTRLTKTGASIGTPAYMSPEQTQGQPADRRTDIWSIGVVLFEMLTGRLPFAGQTEQAISFGIVYTQPEPVTALRSGLPVELDRIVAKALAKSPEERYQNPADVIVDLRSAATSRPTAHVGNVSQSQPSIAVLPFANMSADKENEYFGDGLAEEIINVLAHVPSMKVTARTSSFFFRGTDVEFREIGRRLNVEHILEGSVRRAGNRIRVTAQLVKVRDGFHLWSERYDRELTDIFAIQDEITHAIAAALQTKLSPETAPVRRYVPALRAYEAYLKARDLWFSGARPELLPRFKELLERAIELDPKFGLAHSFLGIYYTMQANLSLKLAREVVPLALAAEQAALRVDPSLAEAHAILAVCIGGYEYDWARAEQHWRLAMAREPASRDVRFWYGNHHLLPVGRTAEALDAMEWGLQGDPLNLMYRWLLARGLRLAGRLDDAEAELRAVLEIDENYPHALAMRGSICAQQGRFEEALTVTRKANNAMPWSNPVIGQLAALLVRTGAASQADAWIEKLGPGTAPGAASGLVIFHALCGDLERAAQWAELAIEQREMPFVQNLGPFLQPTPWWPALAKRMNLPG
jgi:serine/threonine protein kinase/tetratricopeptide (TPR) repeat protein